MQAGGQPRNFAAHRIAMHRAAADRLVQHLGGLLERFLRLRFVGAGGDSFRSGLGQRAGTCADDAVALGALEILPMTLLGRRMNGNMRHNQSFLTARERRSNTARLRVLASFGQKTPFGAEMTPPMAAVLTTPDLSAKLTRFNFAQPGGKSMQILAFWNNKGGTGKTSLAFQAICAYAEKFPKKRILAIDACPQANLSELLLGGLEGAGSHNLTSLQGNNPRRSIAGYFQTRLPSPFAMPAITPADFICKPLTFNNSIALNIDLVAGDALLELQANAIATLSNTQIPGTDTCLAVIDWLKDYITTLGNSYDVVFIDTNPSFSIYTQIALASSQPPPM